MKGVCVSLVVIFTPLYPAAAAKPHISIRLSGAANTVRKIKESRRQASPLDGVQSSDEFNADYFPNTSDEPNSSNSNALPSIPFLPCHYNFGTSLNLLKLTFQLQVQRHAYVQR